jgi:hypothetical protein
MTTRTRTVWFAAVALLVACSPNAPGTQAPLPPTRTTYQLATGLIDLAPGVERTICITKRLSIGTPIAVLSISARQSYTSLLTLYRYNPGVTPAENASPVVCADPDFTAADPNLTPIYVSQRLDESGNRIDTPSGAGFRIEAPGYYMIQAHMLNASAMPVQADIQITIQSIPASDTIKDAGLILMNNQSALTKSYDGKGVGLPPLRATATDAAFVSVDPSVKIWALTTQQNRYGTSSSVTKSKSAIDIGTPVSSEIDPSSPSTQIFAAPNMLSFTTGEGLRWGCQYQNTAAKYVSYGSSHENNEVCMIWAFYTPATGYKVYAR